MKKLYFHAVMPKRRMFEYFHRQFITIRNPQVYLLVSDMSIFLELMQLFIAIYHQNLSQSLKRSLELQASEESEAFAVSCSWTHRYFGLKNSLLLFSLTYGCSNSSSLVFIFPFVQLSDQTLQYFKVLMKVWVSLKWKEISPSFLVLCKNFPSLQIRVLRLKLNLFPYQMKFLPFSYDSAENDKRFTFQKQTFERTKQFLQSNIKLLKCQKNSLFLIPAT